MSAIRFDVCRYFFPWFSLDIYQIFYHIINRCAFIYGHDGVLEKFTRDMQERLLHQVIEPMACDGLRTISVAYRDFTPGKAAINEIHIDKEPNWDDEEYIGTLASLIRHII